MARVAAQEREMKSKLLKRPKESSATPAGSLSDVINSRERQKRALQDQVRRESNNRVEILWKYDDDCKESSNDVGEETAEEDLRKTRGDGDESYSKLVNTANRMDIVENLPEGKKSKNRKRKEVERDEVEEGDVCPKDETLKKKRKKVIKDSDIQNLSSPVDEVNFKVDEFEGGVCLKDKTSKKKKKKRIKDSDVQNSSSPANNVNFDESSEVVYEKSKKMKKENECFEASVGEEESICEDQVRTIKKVKKKKKCKSIEE